VKSSVLLLYIKDVDSEDYTPDQIIDYLQSATLFVCVIDGHHFKFTEIQLALSWRVASLPQHFSPNTHEIPENPHNLYGERPRSFSCLMLAPEWIRIQEKPAADWVMPAKVEAIRAEFIRQCDKLDGFADGIRPIQSTMAFRQPTPRPIRARTID
jgi:hypothetical protein